MVHVWFGGVSTSFFVGTMVGWRLLLDTAIVEWHMACDLDTMALIDDFLVEMRKGAS